MSLYPMRIGTIVALAALALSASVTATPGTTLRASELHINGDFSGSSQLQALQFRQFTPTPSVGIEAQAEGVVLETDTSASNLRVTNVNAGSPSEHVRRDLGAGVLTSLRVRENGLLAIVPDGPVDVQQSVHAAQLKATGSSQDIEIQNMVDRTQSLQVDVSQVVEQSALAGNLVLKGDFTLYVWEWDLHFDGQSRDAEINTGHTGTKAQANGAVESSSLVYAVLHLTGAELNLTAIPGDEAYSYFASSSIEGAGSIRAVDATLEGANAPDLGSGKSTLWGTRLSLNGLTNQDGALAGQLAGADGIDLADGRHISTAAAVAAPVYVFDGAAATILSIGIAAILVLVWLLQRRNAARQAATQAVPRKSWQSSALRLQEAIPASLHASLAPSPDSPWLEAALRLQEAIPAADHALHNPRFKGWQKAALHVQATVPARNHAASQVSPESLVALRRAARESRSPVPSTAQTA
jgi:hypothetical protein